MLDIKLTNDTLLMRINFGLNILLVAANAVKFRARQIILHFNGQNEWLYFKNDCVFLTVFGFA